MRIGYAKGISMQRSESANNEFCEKYNVDRVFQINMENGLHAEK